VSGHITRRQFLTHTGAASLGLAALGASASATRLQANDKMDIALVGAGGRGEWFVECIPGLGENLVALCDVDEARASRSYGLLPDVPKFHDFRKMLDEMGDRIDAVICATPDNTHAVVTAAAIRAGKHIYCEKPLTLKVAEARTLRDLAREYKVATQMGNQGTASPAFRRALEIIQAGEIGEIRDVYVWKDSGGPGARPLPDEEQPVPENLKWDLWLGPAACRPYNERWMDWHSWRCFGTCQLGNWATHTANLAFRALKVDSLWYADPADQPRITVEAEVSEIDEHSFPRWEKISFSVPPRGMLPAFVLHYYNGAGAPGAREEVETLLGRKLDWGDAGERKWTDHAGTLIVGSKGKIWANGHNMEFELLPKEDFEGYEGPPRTLPQSPGHEREWLNACRGGEPAWSNFEYADPLAEFLHLGNIATQRQQAVEFDPLGCRIVNDSRADELLRREYREGWSL